VIPDPRTGIPSPEPGYSNVGLGILLGFGLQILAMPLMGRTPALMFIGAAQLIYMIPAILFANARGLHRLKKGLIIAASIVALLNAACWGLIFQFS